MYNEPYRGRSIINGTVTLCPSAGFKKVVEHGIVYSKSKLKVVFSSECDFHQPLLLAVAVNLTSLWGVVLVLWVYEQRPFSDSLLQERSLGENHLHWNPKQEITQDSRQLVEALASMLDKELSKLWILLTLIKLWLRIF